MRQTDKASLRRELAKACAIVYGVGSHMTYNELVTYVLEHGIPPQKERDLLLAERLGDNAEEG